MCTFCCLTINPECVYRRYSPGRHVRPIQRPSPSYSSTSERSPKVKLPYMGRKGKICHASACMSLHCHLITHFMFLGWEQFFCNHYCCTSFLVQIWDLKSFIRMEDHVLKETESPNESMTETGETEAAVGTFLRPEEIVKTSQGKKIIRRNPRTITKM